MEIDENSDQFSLKSAKNTFFEQSTKNMEFIRFVLIYKLKKLTTDPQNSNFFRKTLILDSGNLQLRSGNKENKIIIRQGRFTIIISLWQNGQICEFQRKKTILFYQLPY